MKRRSVKVELDLTVYAKTSADEIGEAIFDVLSMVDLPEVLNDVSLDGWDITRNEEIQ